MFHFHKHGWTVLFVLAALLPFNLLRIDTGPKPSMEFQFVQAPGSTPITITGGTLFECDQSDCSDAAPLPKLGPQGFRCDAQGCSAIAYGFKTYHKIEIQFSDGVTRQSNVFQTAGFDSIYTVTIEQNALTVNGKSGSLFKNLPRNVTFIAAAICGLCALFIIAVVIVVIVLVRRSRKK